MDTWGFKLFYMQPGEQREKLFPYSTARHPSSQNWKKVIFSLKSMRGLSF